MNRVENATYDERAIVDARHEYRSRLVGGVRTDIDHNIALLSVECCFHERFKGRNKLLRRVLRQVASIEGARERASE